MIFHPPEWAPKIFPAALPDDIPLYDFLHDEKYGRRPIAKSRNPFTCAITGKTYTTQNASDRKELLARSLSKRLGWSPNDGCSPWDKTVCIFSLNSIDYITIAYAAHRLNGIVTPANAVYSAAELAHQLVTSDAKALFTCTAVIDVAMKACEKAGLSRDRVFLIDIPGCPPVHGLSLEDLVREGQSVPALPPLVFKKGQAARQTAFLCYSSGTSGLPKAVMISHQNIMANILQLTAYESHGRRQKGVDTQYLVAPLPMSHIFSLVVACHITPWRGDGYIVHPRYELETYLAAIQRYKVGQSLVVPPMLIQMLREKEVCSRYDLSSIRYIFSGAAPLGEETIQALLERFPNFTIGQAYGMTETSVVATAPSEHDIMHNASGSLLPGYRVKLVDLEGTEIQEHGVPGEVWMSSPSVVLGYFNNEKATSETFVHDEDGRWIRSGDEGLFVKSPQGNDQLIIVDRIKELIKVSGHQVAPAELEAHILAHPEVADVAVIQIPDERAGEVPKAFVVTHGSPTQDLAQDIAKWVADHKAHYKRIKGGVEFVTEIPKSPSGKILRRLLRDREREKRRQQGAKL